MQVAQVFTGQEGKYVTRKETIRGVREIIAGKHDMINEALFYVAGGIEDVIQRYEEESRGL